MIKVTKINGNEMVVNADLIEFIENTPDTLISLTTGRKIMVLEDIDEVIRLAVAYRSRARIHPVPTGGTGSVFEG
jgi:flagellar protein FlbD